MSPHRLLVRGGEVVDGTGTPPRRAHVLVEHGVIAAVALLASVVFNWVDRDGRAFAAGAVTIVFAVLTGFVIVPLAVGTTEKPSPVRKLSPVAVTVLLVSAIPLYARVSLAAVSVISLGVIATFALPNAGA